MKRKTNRKLVVLLVTVLVFSSILIPTVFAADNLTTIKGWFADIKIFSNNQQIKMDVKPFVINGTTYVPVRFISEMLNKDVSWNQANYRIDITDKPDTNYNYVLQQMIQKQEKINELEAKVKQLEAELASKKSSVSNLTDLEKYLNKEYDIYKKVEFDIVLSGSTKDIKVKIYIDRDDNSRWSSLTTSDIKTYIEDIVDDIQYEFKDANITGYIENDYTGKQVADFYLNSKGKLVIDTNYISSGSIYNLYDLEDYLNNKHYEYKGARFDIELSWDKNDIRVDVYVDEYEWDKLGSYYQELYLEDLYREISYDFPDEYVFGYVYDNYYNNPYELNYFDFDSKGYVYIK